MFNNIKTLSSTLLLLALSHKVNAMPTFNVGAAIIAARDASPSPDIATTGEFAGLDPEAFFPPLASDFFTSEQTAPTIIVRDLDVGATKTIKRDEGESVETTSATEDLNPDDFFPPLPPNFFDSDDIDADIYKRALSLSSADDAEPDLTTTSQNHAKRLKQATRKQIVNRRASGRTDFEKRLQASPSAYTCTPDSEGTPSNTKGAIISGNYAVRGFNNYEPPVKYEDTGAVACNQLCAQNSDICELTADFDNTCYLGYGEITKIVQSPTLTSSTFTVPGQTCEQFKDAYLAQSSSNSDNFSCCNVVY